MRWFDMGKPQCLRCPVCLTNWPLNEHDYGVCPIDLEETRPGSDAPLDEKEARSLVNHIMFDRYLEENGRR